MAKSTWLKQFNLESRDSDAAVKEKLAIAHKICIDLTFHCISRKLSFERQTYNNNSNRGPGVYSLEK